jgi:hypothetical protein
MMDKVLPPDDVYDHHAQDVIKDSAVIRIEHWLASRN